MPCSLPTTLSQSGGGHVPWHRKCPAQPEECSGAPPLLGSLFRAEKLLHGDGLDTRSIPPGLAAPIQVEMVAGCDELYL